MTWFVYISVIVLTFAVLFLLDWGFHKLFRSKQQYRTGMAVHLNKRYLVAGILLTVLGVAMLGQLSKGFNWILVLAAVILEIMGIIIICVGAVRDFVAYFSGRNLNIRLDLAESMALALEFMLGGEILRTIIAHEFHDILIVGCIIVLRVSLTVLIHWESKHLEKSEK